MPATSSLKKNSRNSLRDDAVSSTKEMDDGKRNKPAALELPTSDFLDSHKASQNKPGSRFPEKSAILPSSLGSVASSMPTLNAQPDNFDMVIPGLFRSSYPKPNNFPFLKSLQLKTVVTLVRKDEIDHEFTSFTQDGGIQQVIFDMKGTKKEAIPSSTMRSILEIVLNRSNYPLLLHCNHGKHRTGCVVAAVRHLSGWPVDAALDEYKRFAAPKVRDCDVDYIRNFQCAPLRSLYNLHCKPARFGPLQQRNFFRALLFSTVTLVLWLTSGYHMSVAPDNISGT